MTFGLHYILTATSLPLNVILERMSDGMIETVKIFVITLVLSMPLALLVAFGRMSRFLILRWIVNAYISIMRGTPLMLQVIAIYFGPYFLFGISISSEYKFTAIIIAFVVNYAAYFAEIYRSGIESMPRGQYEAAHLLGYSKVKTFTKIIWPQVFGDKRSDLSCKGYFTGIFCFLYRDVFACKAACFIDGKFYTVTGGRGILLYF